MPFYGQPWFLSILSGLVAVLLVVQVSNKVGDKLRERSAAKAAAAEDDAKAEADERERKRAVAEKEKETATLVREKLAAEMGCELPPEMEEKKPRKKASSRKVSDGGKRPRPRPGAAVPSGDP